ncbi:ABC transporter substrate-binding protein [Desulfobotulus sp.]|jgi:NitT/TauT family transport system substrate-binding protein|uniref:ABC transporter substrate-binding protein n=1 Tax=Desulfobotulus sp. TaxID=1940337 RepID=UPI002A366E9A|nr:ABC transporter substrate-binding protein [Desulfobotulus sp.]MDY0162006.1 ABC transporter substrate-binding protein [Desulfobotulus sp.]
MAEKPLIRIGHIKITDHLILGVSKSKMMTNEEKFDHCSLETVAKMGWNEIADALTEGSIDGAFVLAPTAMDLFKSGVGIKLLLFTHKSGSILVKNKAANIQKIEDFSGKIVLIPYQLSIHNMLFHKILSEKGLNPGRSGEAGVDVFLEVMAPAMMNDAIKYDDEGEIAGFIVAEPIGSQAISGGYGEEFCLSRDLWPDHPCCVFVVRSDVVAKYPDAIQEITNSLVRSGQFIHEAPEAASEIGSLFLSQDKGVIEKVLKDPRQRISTHELRPVIQDLEAIQEYMISKMHVMRDKIDMEKFVDFRFADAAGAK